MFMVRGAPFRALSKSPEETVSIGRSLGGLLAPGDVVYIYGDVGAGKTVFVKGVASALNVKGHVTSPTFIIMNVYDGDPPLYHYDAYRIESPAELFEAGFFECAGGECVVAVEWANRIAGTKPGNCIEVWIDAADNDDTHRNIRVEFD